MRKPVKFHLAVFIGCHGKISMVDEENALVEFSGHPKLELSGQLIAPAEEDLEATSDEGVYVQLLALRSALQGAVAEVDERLKTRAVLPLGPPARKGLTQ